MRDKQGNRAQSCVGKKAKCQKKEKYLLFFNASHHLGRRRSSGLNSEAGGHCIMHFHLVPCTDTPYQACQIQKKQFSKRCDQILMKFNSFLAPLLLGDIIDKNGLCFSSVPGFIMLSLAALSKCYGFFFPPSKAACFYK